MGAVGGQAWAALRWFVASGYLVLLLESPAEEMISHSDGHTMEFITATCTPHMDNCHVKDKSLQCDSETQDAGHRSVRKPPINRWSEPCSSLTENGEVVPAGRMAS